LLLQMGDRPGANKVLAELPDTPENRFTRIGIAIRTGDTALAEALYEGFATASYEDGTEAIFAAARSAELLDRNEDAISWYERLDGTERELAGRVRRAALNAQAGRVEEARAILQAVRNEGNASMQLETMVLEAQILVDANQPGEAYEVLSQAREQFPDDARLLYTRALVAVSVDRFDEAEQDLRQVIGQDPSNAGAMNALGYTLADRGERLDEAESLIRTAYELQPEEPAIIDSMGWIAYRKGRLEEAETFLRRAFLRDRNAEIAAHLGEVLWAQDKRRDAIVVWAEGLKIDANNAVLNDTLKRLGVSL
jgi:Flp pilus assembly protein TadD